MNPKKSRKRKKPPSDPHRKAIQAIEDCITAGGLHAMAVLRGSHQC